MAKNVLFTNGSYKCQTCGGSVPYNPPVNSGLMSFNVNQTTQIKGEKTGRFYMVRPNEVAVDIDLGDMELFEKAGHIRTQAVEGMKLYTSRLGA